MWSKYFSVWPYEYPVIMDPWQLATLHVQSKENGKLYYALTVVCPWTPEDQEVMKTAYLLFCPF
jgi:hypothetical protein